MNNQTTHITVLGSINMDLFAHTQHFPVPGETCQGMEFRELSGGKGANQAVAIAKLGGTATLIGCVGTDSFGSHLITKLEEAGVMTPHIRTVTGISSGIASIWVNDEGNNSIIVIPGANGEVSTQDVDAGFTSIAKSQFLLAQLECPLQTVSYAFTRVKAETPTVQTVLNPAPARPLDSQLLSQTDILIVNETELASLTHSSVTDVASARQAGQALVESGSREVIVTLGDQGSLYLSKTEDYYEAAIKVTAINTTGAGDCFIGAFLTARGTGASNSRALSFATQAAAVTVTRHGAQDAMPTPAEINTFLKTHSS